MVVVHGGGGGSLDCRGRGDLNNLSGLIPTALLLSAPSPCVPSSVCTAPMYTPPPYPSTALFQVPLPSEAVIF